MVKLIHFRVCVKIRTLYRSITGILIKTKLALCKFFVAKFCLTSKHTFVSVIHVHALLRCVHMTYVHGHVNGTGR